MTTPHDLIAVLQHHIGEGNGISGEDLALALGVPSRRVRHLIDDAIEKLGVCVLGHPATGYFIGQTQEELNRVCQFHTDRAMHELTKASQLRRSSLADLNGQIHLPT